MAPPRCASCAASCRPNPRDIRASLAEAELLRYFSSSACCARWSARRWGWRERLA